jgi:hypothetical protein
MGLRPGESGWLKRYIDFHAGQLAGGSEPASTPLNGDPKLTEQSLYFALHPSGLVYGYPVGFPYFPESKARNWGMKTRAKILLAESHLTIGIRVLGSPGADPKPVIEEVLMRCKQFYAAIYPRYDQQGKTLVGRKRTLLSQVEYILENRVQIRNDWRNFWASFFHNSLVFIDLMYFYKYLLHPDPDTLVQVRNERIDFRKALLELIGCAAWSSGTVHPEGKEMFRHFLESAEMPLALRREFARRFLAQIPLDEVDFSVATIWLLRKYLLEMTILTTLASPVNQEVNHPFLEEVCTRLDLTKVDLGQSMQATEAFVAAHRDKLFYFQPRHLHLKATDVLLAQFQREVSKNQRGLQREIRQSKELVALLAKSTRQELTTEEWDKVKYQLIEILKTIPAFTIFMLPMGSVTLPFLIRLFPRSWLFPNLYDEDDD